MSKKAKILLTVAACFALVFVGSGGRHLDVHVESADGTVEISLPAGLLGSIARAIS